MTIMPVKVRSGAGEQRRPRRWALPRTRQRLLVGAWLLAAGGMATMFVLGLPEQYRRFVSLTGPEPYGDNPRATWLRLRADGWTVQEYAGAALVLDLLLASGFSALALVVLRHAGRGWWRRGFALSMVAFGLSFGLVPEALAQARPGWQVPVAVLTVVGLAGSVTALTLFPDGKVRRTWTLIIPIGYAAWLTGRQIRGVGEHLVGSGAIVTVLVVANVAVGQWLRYRSSRPHQRDQLRWAAAGIVAGLIGFLITGYVLPVVLGAAVEPGSTGALLLTAGLFGSLLLVPAGMAVALVHGRLWDVDLALNRGLVYGTLTLLVGTVYATLVWTAARLGRTGGRGLMVAASIMITLVLHPVRMLLQRQVNRLMYGDRDNPADVLARLARSLNDRLRTDEVLSTIAVVVHDGLRVPSVRVTLNTVDQTSARVGPEAPECVCIPILHRGERVGELAVAARRGGQLGRRDARFLHEIAALSGPAVAAVRLTSDLQLSRERLVLAREEERKRIRDDLHDSIGPALASIALQAAALRRGTAPDGELLAPLTRLQADAAAAVGEMRTLVRGLRPPALDNRGLAEAVRELGGALTEAGILTSVDVEPLPAPLPAAVDLAAYRIAQEACTNVLRHSEARSCQVELRNQPRGLVLRVTDDGCGLPQGYEPGIGLSSMRERAAELGGVCSIGGCSGGGTEVRAFLPIGESGDG